MTGSPTTQGIALPLSIQVNVLPSIVSPPAECAEGKTWCDGVCIDLKLSAEHCGACHNACSDGSQCVSGVCSYPCPDNMTLCGEFCVDLFNDALHCGGCFEECANASECIGARCVPGLFGVF